MAVDLNVAATEVVKGASAISSVNPVILFAGIGLVALAIFLIFFLKRVIVNSILGLISFIVLYFLGIKLPFFATFVVSVIFGLAGVGTMLVLYFFHLIP
ncbi:MAG: hypothetical protein GXN93_00205 [Candidatus Diapherotrites archaeon]|nr:hypothetical protein [Candidatus Diapherotrites archaeon]